MAVSFVEDRDMYEDFYGLREKPFSITPDPKFLYRSASHASAFDVLQFAARRREGFVVITGDIGTGKTTVCRAILDQLDRRTFTALVLNPLIDEGDLLRVILQDFGVVSREEVRRGRLANVSKQEMVDTLNDFLLSLLPLGANAILIFDEAQNLSPAVLEQVRILSNLETDKEKLMQIVLVGQPGLRDLLARPELRQLDQRVSVRYELKPLTREETGAYVEHRLSIAGSESTVTFPPAAVDVLHKRTGGIPRLINMVCDRALLGSYSSRSTLISPEAVSRAADSLELGRAHRLVTGLRQRAAGMAAAAAVTAVLGFAGGMLWQQRASARTPVTTTADAGQPPAAEPSAPPPSTVATAPASSGATPSPAPSTPVPASGAAAVATSGGPIPAPLPQTTPRAPGTFSVVVASFKVRGQADALVADLEQQGYQGLRVRTISAHDGAWHQVLTGPYAEEAAARDVQARIRRLPGYADAALIRH